jgi:hypothetical protein
MIPAGHNTPSAAPVGFSRRRIVATLASWKTNGTKPIGTNPNRKYPDMQVRRL